MKSVIHKVTKRRAAKDQPLPKGLKAAAPVKNKALHDLLVGPDVASGGTHAVVGGHPLLNGQSGQR